MSGDALCCLYAAAYLVPSFVFTVVLLYRLHRLGDDYS